MDCVILRYLKYETIVCSSGDNKNEEVKKNIKNIIDIKRKCPLRKSTQSRTKWKLFQQLAHVFILLTHNHESLREHLCTFQS